MGEGEASSPGKGGCYFSMGGSLCQRSAKLVYSAESWLENWEARKLRLAQK